MLLRNILPLLILLDRPFVLNFNLSGPILWF